MRVSELHSHPSRQTGFRFQRRHAEIRTVVLQWGFCVLILFAAGAESAADDVSTLNDSATPRRIPESTLQGENVKFRATSESVPARKYIDQGVWHLHCGDLQLADWCFDCARHEDPRCAIAWWGLAVAHESDRELAEYYIRRAKALHGNASHRERRWISAFASYFETGRNEKECRIQLTRTLDSMVVDDPDDKEATAFLVRQVALNADAGVNVEFRTAIMGLAREFIRSNPSHPIRYSHALLCVERVDALTESSADWLCDQGGSSPSALLAAARLYEVQEKWDEADAAYSSALAALKQFGRQYRLCPAEIAAFGTCVAEFARYLDRRGNTAQAIDVATQFVEVAFVVAEPDEKPNPEIASNEHRHTDLPTVSEHLTTAAQRLLIDVAVEARAWDVLMRLSRSEHLRAATSEIEVRKTIALAKAHYALGHPNQLAEQRYQLQQHARDVLSVAPVDARDLKLQYLVREGLTELSAMQRRLSPRKGGRIRRVESTNSENEPRVTNSTTVATGHGDAKRFAIWDFPTAPPLALPDRHGKVLNLKDFHGRPVVLVFYLGAGCPHCIEQLQSFAPLKDAYAAAGVEVIAVSPDSVAGLQETFMVTGAEESIPFLLVSDHDLKAFRAFGAWDARNKAAWHGTFLLDATGRILWQRTGVDPVMETAELLAEARRLQRLWNSTSYPSNPTGKQD